MNGTERNILAFAYAKRVVGIFLWSAPEGGLQYCVRAPRAVVDRFYFAAAPFYPANLLEDMRPTFSMETDAGGIYSYTFDNRGFRDWLAAHAIAAIMLWRHRTQKDLEAGDCPTVGELTSVVLAYKRLPTGGSPVANAARIVTIVQRQWRDKNRRRVAPAGKEVTP